MRFLNPTAFTFLSLAVLLTGLIFSPFLLSLGIWGLAIAAFWESVFAPGGFRAAMVRFWKKPEYALLTLLLLVPFISGLWSENSGFWLTLVRLRIPFFVLPWAFVNLPVITVRQWQWVIWGLVAVLTLTCIGVGFNFLLHYDSIMIAMRKGQPIPVPRGHIRFNLILVSGLAMGVYAFFKKTGFRWLKATVLVFLFAFVHVLSVRSGLAALYAGMATGLMYLIVVRKKWLTGLLVLGTGCLTIWLAVQFLPSFAQKMGYMAWDWEQYREGTGRPSSDNERWISIQAGWDIFKNNPWFGVGAGDLPEASRAFAAEAFPHLSNFNKLPHNQFLFILAGTGIVGFLASMAGLYAGICYRRYRHFPWFWIFQSIVLASFLVEYTLETSIGAAFYLFFHLLTLQLAEKEAEP